MKTRKSLAQLQEQYNRLWQLNKGKHDKQVNAAFAHVRAQMCKFLKIEPNRGWYTANPLYHQMFWCEIPKANYITL